MANSSLNDVLLASLAVVLLVLLLNALVSGVPTPFSRRAAVREIDADKKKKSDAADDAKRLETVRGERDRYAERLAKEEDLRRKAEESRDKLKRLLDEKEMLCKAANMPCITALADRLELRMEGNPP